jgi:hypothetical protein
MTRLLLCRSRAAVNSANPLGTFDFKEGGVYIFAETRSSIDERQAVCFFREVTGGSSNGNAGGSDLIPDSPTAGAFSDAAFDRGGNARVDGITATVCGVVLTLE